MGWSMPKAYVARDGRDWRAFAYDEDGIVYLKDARSAPEMARWASAARRQGWEVEAVPGSEAGLGRSQAAITTPALYWQSLPNAWWGGPAFSAFEGVDDRMGAPTGAGYPYGLFPSEASPFEGLAGAREKGRFTVHVRGVTTGGWEGDEKEYEETQSFTKRGLAERWAKKRARDIRDWLALTYPAFTVRVGWCFVNEVGPGTAGLG